jgi:hypothetical protein
MQTYTFTKLDITPTLEEWEESYAYTEEPYTYLWDPSHS